MELVSPLVDHTCYFRHAPVRLCACAPARRCKHVWLCMRLRGCELLQRSFSHEKIVNTNRAAAPAEWHQLLSA